MKRYTTIEFHEIKVKTGSEEELILHEFRDGQVVKVVTVKLGRWGAEYIAEKLHELLKARRAHAGSLETAMKAP